MRSFIHTFFLKETTRYLMMGKLYLFFLVASPLASCGKFSIVSYSIILNSMFFSLTDHQMCPLYWFLYLFNNFQTIRLPSSSFSLYPELSELYKNINHRVTGFFKHSSVLDLILYSESYLLEDNLSLRHNTVLCSESTLLMK